MYTVICCVYIMFKINELSSIVLYQYYCLEYIKY